MSDFLVPADVINNPLVKADAHLNVLDVNQHAEDIFFKKRNELLGKNFITLCRESGINVPENLSTTIQKETNINFEVELVNNGQTRTLIWNVVKLQAEQVHYYILSANDISAYKKLLQRKEGLQAYLEHIVDNIPCYIYWKDVNSVYLGCNKKFAEAAGFTSPKAVVGKTDYDFVWGKTEATLFRQSDLEVLRGISKLDFEEPQLQADGKHAVVLASKVPMRDKTGKTIGVLGIYFDITDRKRAEEELKEAKEKAEIANQAKSEFLAVVSHELRLPLTAILGMAQLLSGENLLPEHQEQVNDIIQSSEHLHALVNDILDFAKLEAGKIELHPAPLDLKKIIEEVATMLANQAKNKKLELLIDYPEDVPSRIQGDARAIRQVLLNLCGNALKFTERGHIVIKVDCQEKTTTHAVLLLSVEDTGIGIPEEKLAMVFDRFSQVDSSRSRRYGGVGLGLTITKQYIVAMGGEINVQSTRGEGSVFTCTIPFELQNVKNNSPWNIYKSNVRILIVDDTLRGKILQKQIGSSLCQVATGAEALNMIRAAYQTRQPFDIVIIDQCLENNDAMQLAKTIRQQRLQQPMLLLAIPGHLLSTENIARSAGFFGCITKPTHPTEFLIDLTAFWEKWLDREYEAKKLESAVAREQCIPQALLVEDDPLVQKVHYMMLERAGCQVDIAKDGKQALASFAEKTYDIIFMDIGLPDITGFDVAIAIRQRENNGQHIPIIGLTGYSNEEDRLSCFNAGMDAVAIKPVSPDELKLLLQKWVEKKTDL